MAESQRHVTPTDPPSMAVLIAEHRRFPINDPGDADRVYYVLARLVFSETFPLDGPTAQGRGEHGILSRPYRLAVEEPPPNRPGWRLLAEVTVRAGQTVIAAEHIRPPGWHHQHGAGAALAVTLPAQPHTRRNALIFNAITSGLSKAGRFVALTERDAIARRVGEVLDREAEQELTQLSEQYIQAGRYGVELMNRANTAETVIQNARRVATYWRDAAKAGDPGRDPADASVLHACATILDALASPENGASVLTDLGLTAPGASHPTEPDHPEEA